ncbi:hypothetical protein [Aeromicrobium sp.]|uniref:hypothetical protein n=1 Tax=Aeromicrobium sp. TaxID=1871063 RepID=UPI0040334FBE
MATPEPAQATPAPDDARPTRSYEDLVPGSLAWIAATHGGSSDDGAAELEDQPGDHARRDAGDRRRAAKQAKIEKRLAARRAREEQRAAAKAEKDRARRERAEAKDREAAERAEAKEREAEQAAARKAAQEVEDERTRQLAEEQAAAARVEQDRRRQAESAAAEQKAQRREKSKAAALAALAGRPTTARADEADAPSSQDVAGQDPAPEDPDAQDPMPGDGTPEQESTTTRSEDGSAADLAEETALLDAVGAAHQDVEATEAGAQDVRADARESEHTSQGPVDRGGRGDDRRAAAAATVARRREKAEAKERARAEKGEAARRRRAEKAPAREVDDSVPEPPSVPQESSSFGPARVLSLVGVAIGVLGLVASVLLALAALLVAFGFDADAGVLRAVAVVADPLTAPLRGLVAFSGENAAAKEAFVAYGGGSVVYLIVGVAAPSLLSRRDA